MTGEASEARAPLQAAGCRGGAHGCRGAGQDCRAARGAASRVHAVTRDDLVGQFIGHTAPKTKEAIARAAGGVLFIDEAYYLFRPENERDYGQEVIEILLTEMENERGDLVVIFAGYPDRMATFFSANPGLSSRVPHHIAFEDYDHEELMRIADLMVESEGF